MEQPEGRKVVTKIRPYQFSLEDETCSMAV
jgi:hypothetical protein